MTGFNVEAEQLRAHAGSIDAIKQRFAKVKSASSHITADSQAYGVLCGWISGVLEGRHTDIDAVIATVESNLELVAKELRASADSYAAADQDNAAKLRAAGGGQ
ncbi:type VII secretion target [Lentzea sp. BCCO 10_0856]|uniref:Type VII secretion target n=1 Tax=Lentzea miocenica TaxID=3095431 RepID=A0ABU4STU9_9PSEU|nr:type VII secretion target [Lentzea sp. BCCO 10_0856]MDX8029314.1 type VII secretion target [Lentzea sp. BCCO 10_0856]